MDKIESTAMQRIDGITRFCRVFREIAMWLLFADAVIIIINIVMRRFFNMPIYGITEMIRYMMLFSASFAIVENEWVDGNINMHLVIDKMPQSVRSLTLFVVNAGTTIGMVVVSILLVDQFKMRFADQAATTELHIPLWLPSLTLAIGFWLLTFVLVCKTVTWFWMRATKNSVDFREMGVVKDN